MSQERKQGMACEERKNYKNGLWLAVPNSCQFFYTGGTE